MTTIDLSSLDKQSGENAIWALRGKAINSYAILESSLCLLMTTLSGTPPGVGATIFYRIASARARNDILTKLVKKRHGAKFNIWLNSFIKAVGQLDQTRNEIVHWHSVVDVYVDEKGQTVTGLSFMPPNFWDADGNTPRHTSATLVEFMTKCDYAARTCNIFAAGVHGLGGMPDRSADFIKEFSFPAN